MSALRDFTGERIGRLVVLGRAEDFVQPNGRRRTQWDCVCACGDYLTVLSDNLRKAHTKSCGCLRVDTCSFTGESVAIHRRSRSREWWAWTGAKQRCHNPRCRSYPDYGGRGIKVCAEWLGGFPAFYADMGRALEGMTLERVDVNGDYCKENCVWATSKEQSRNKRNTVRVEFKGTETSLAALAEAYGITRDLAYDRFCRQGWSIEKTLNTPKRKRND